MTAISSRGRGRPKGVRNREFYSVLLDTADVCVPVANREGRLVGVDQTPDGVRAVFEDCLRDRFAVPVEALFAHAARMLHEEDPSAQRWLKIQPLLTDTEVREVHGLITAIEKYEQRDGAAKVRLQQLRDDLARAGMSVSISTFYDKLRRYRELGPVGLLRTNHKALTDVQKEELLQPLYDSAVAVARELQGQPKITLRQFVQKVHDTMATRNQNESTARAIAEISGLDTDQVLGSVYKAAHLHMELDKRRGRVGLNRQRHKFTSARTPFSTIQIDRTQLNIRLTDRKGRAMDVVDVLMAIDVCTRRILGFLICPRNARGAHVQALLIHLCRGLIAPRITKSALPGLPTELELSAELHQLAQLNEIVVDRGSPESSHETQGFLTSLGVNIRFAPPGRGDAKGVIEGFYSVLTKVLRVFPGATGSNLMQTGHDSTVSTVLELEQFAAILTSYIENVYHRQPSVKSETPGIPKMSPNEKLMWEMTVGSGLPTVDATDVSRIRSALRREFVALDVRGIMHHGLYYQDEQGKLAGLLNSLHGSTVNDLGHKSVHILFHDHYDDVVFAEIPGETDLIPCFPHHRPQEAFADVRTEFHLGSLFNLGQTTPLHLRVPGASKVVSHPFKDPAEGLFSILSASGDSQQMWSEAKKAKKTADKLGPLDLDTDSATDQEATLEHELTNIQEMLHMFGVLNNEVPTEDGMEL